MSFIVKKKVHGKEYFYLNENKRIDGKVKTKTLAYLGKTRGEAEKKAEELKTKIKENKFKMSEEQSDNKMEFKNVKKESTKISVEEMAAFCKRKGFVYPSGEIYGGLSGFWDFGVLGAEMKKNLKDSWWRYHVYQRDDLVGIDGAIITNPKVWEASGHVDNFVDVAVINKKTKEKFKVDKFEAKEYEDNPQYEVQGEFNPMFTTNVGPVVSDSIKSYLRPETAQLIFSDFKNIVENARMKLPFGIAQMGKSFRNEIAPRDFLFRCREFEQMEIEYFINPSKECEYEIPSFEVLVYSEEMQKGKKDPEKMKIKEAFEKGIIKTKWHAYWLAQELLWFVSLGVDSDKFRIRQHVSDEKSHYSADTWDLEYEFPFGWRELLGMANRTDFDLKQHEKVSKKDLKIFDEETKQKLLPHVVCEPSLGVERAFLVFLFDAYYFDEKRQNIVLKIHPKLSPIKAAVFPIVKKPEFEKMSENILKDLRQEWNILYDKSGSIGRRYSRNDEMGTPFCITVDDDSIKNKDVTIRDRDSTKQIRVKVSELRNVMRNLIEGNISFEKSGKIVK
jgi:glycyl-tRNA synthetase